MRLHDNGRKSPVSLSLNSSRDIGYPNTSGIPSKSVSNSRTEMSSIGITGIDANGIQTGIVCDRLFLIILSLLIIYILHILCIYYLC